MFGRSAVSGYVSFALITLTLCGILRAAAPATITPDPLPARYAKSADFALRINGVAVPVVGFSGDYDYATCTAGDGPFSVEVTDLSRNVSACSVSPLKLGVQVAVAGNVVRFDVNGPEYLIVSPAGRKRLVLAIDPPEVDVPAVGGAGVIDVTAFGADRTAGQSSTDAIQRAIDQAATKGGTVVVPRGVYAITNLTLRSNVSLYLAAGAVLRATGEPADFRNDFHKNSQQHDGTWLLATAKDAQNVKVFGRGTIDGDGRHYSRTKRFGNHLLVPMTCRGFVASGIVLRDSASWGFVPVRCQDVSVTHVKMFNALDIGENDGIDVCECQNVQVRSCVAIALDDPFSTKTMSGAAGDITRNWYGEQQGNRDILFENCLAWTRCFAFKIGAGVIQPQSDITIRKCVAFDGAHGFGISHEWGKAEIRKILVEDLDVEQVSCECVGRSWAQMFIKRGGSVRDVILRHITVRDRGTTPFKIHGLNDDSTIERVRLEDIRMPGSAAAATTAAELGLDLLFAKDVTVSP